MPISFQGWPKQYIAHVYRAMSDYVASHNIDETSAGKQMAEIRDLARQEYSEPKPTTWLASACPCCEGTGLLRFGPGPDPLASKRLEEIVRRIVRESLAEIEKSRECPTRGRKGIHPCPFCEGTGAARI